MHPVEHLDQPGANTSRAAVYQPVSTPDLSKIAPVYNVCSYGADATGASESAAAIQAALNAAAAAGGGVVLVPAGIYIISQILQIGSGVTLQGEGMGVTTIRAASGFSPTQVSGLNGLTTLVVAGNAGGSNIVISGLTFDGNQANISKFPGWADGGRFALPRPAQRGQSADQQHRNYKCHSLLNVHRAVHAFLRKLLPHHLGPRIVDFRADSAGWDSPERV